MKRIVLATILMIAFFGLVSAEGLKPTFYTGAGIGLPKKPDNIVPGYDIGISDMYKSAINFGAGIGIPLSPKFELVGRFRYSSFAFDEQGFSDKFTEQADFLLGFGGLGTFDIEVTGADVKVIEFLADVKFTIPTGGEGGTFHPYLLGGLGMAKATLGEWAVDGSATVFPLDILVLINAEGEELSETKLVYNFGVGFDWMASPTVGVYFDARYAQVAVTDYAIGYFPIQVGLIFRPGP